METWKLVLLIAGVLGVIIGNIMLLKHTAEFKLEKRIDEFKHGKKVNASGEVDEETKVDKKETPDKRV